MGACFSKPQQESNSSLNESLLDGQTFRSDINRYQNVSSNRPNSPEVENFLSSHLKKTEFWKNKTNINLQNEICKDTYALVSGRRPFPPIMENHEDCDDCFKH